MVIYSVLRVRHRWKYLIQGCLVLLLVTIAIVALMDLNTRSVLIIDSQLNTLKLDVTIKSHIKVKSSELINNIILLLLCILCYCVVE